ncbi:23467_t:CDS:2 [Gigaspora margarita]|uniref:23467_t:CDS:1 n=1 Tax=Gigaspora margarita TaxID=4874 RepID=A0ABN7UDB4_GIGMA|nr:23467_t:CDS:2 [Gigaspora margarita]
MFVFSATNLFYGLTFQSQFSEISMDTRYCETTKNYTEKL